MFEIEKIEENGYDLMNNEDEKQLQMIIDEYNKNRNKIKMALVVQKVIMSPIVLIMDLVFAPVRILGIIKKTYELVSYQRNKQQAELIAMEYENSIANSKDELKVKVDSFILKNMKSNFMNEEITDKYKMFDELMKKKEGV